VEKVVVENADRTAGILIEPLIQGASGLRPAPQGFLKHLRDLCDRHELLLVVDEVATGFGRTGTMFACEQEEVIPDLMAMAKGISGGYLPLAATAVSENIFESFISREDRFRTFFHGHTYTGNPLACSAAIASLDIFESEKVILSLKPKMESLQRGLAEFKKHPNVGDVRQVGMMCAIELVEDKERKSSFDPSRKIGASLCRETRNHGVILRPLSDVLVIMPPFCIDSDQIDRIFYAIEKSIAKILM
jgi:adenosylmethionine-8-amino-7-oxononanoate aminotransferase